MERRHYLSLDSFILLIDKKYSTVSDILNHTGGVMVSLLASIVIDRGSKEALFRSARLDCDRSWVQRSPVQVKPKTIKLVFVTSPLSAVVVV